MKLYELTANYATILQRITDDDTQSIGLRDTLDAIKDQIEVKAENIAKMIRTIDADMDALSNEEKRLADRRRALGVKREGLKNYLEDQLAIAELDRVKTPLFTIAFQKNPPSVQVVDEKAVPAKFYIVHEPTFDKKLIAERLKAGEEVPGVVLTQGHSLRIR